MATPGQRSRTLSSGVAVAGLVFVAGAVAGCTDEPIEGGAPSAPPSMADVPAGERVLFFDDFQKGLPAWEPMSGAWDVNKQGEYGAVGRGYALSYAGNPNWSNYQVSARVTVDDDRQGYVGVVGRGDSDHYYFELVLGRNPQAQKSWAIRQRRDHQWTTLASGAFDYALETPYLLRLSFQGLQLVGFISSDGGRSFHQLGAAKAAVDSWQVGRFGVVTYGGAARFDDVGVTGGEVVIALADLANGWGQLSLLRDDTNTFTNVKPMGGWYVTPIHVNLRPDGKVLVTGFSREGASGCSGTGTNAQRENGMTWLLDPVSLELDPDMDPDTDATLFTTPINERNLDPVHDVLYCAGHSTMADGRVFFSAGTRYPDTLPDSNPERGLRYSRIFDGTAMLRVGASTTSGLPHLTLGGQENIVYPDPGNVGDGTSTAGGEKWYPTTLLMPDGKMLIFGGFHWSAASGAGVKPNNSFEIFDPAVWDANHATYPYSVLTQHINTGLSADLPPTRGYSNMFLLPKPVPASVAGGFARSVAIFGGRGRVALFNHEPGPVNLARLHARTNAWTISPDSTSFPNERAEGGSGVLLSDGRIMVVNGGHTGDGARRAYVYDPYADTWHGPTGAVCPAGSPPSCSLNAHVSRMYGQAVQLPDGKVLAINGFGAQSGTGQAFEEKGNEMDVSDAEGDPRQPVLIDPYANPMTAVPLPIWPEPTHRGYHSISLLLKDGRVLVGGGKDKTHATGCEKNDMRIFTPPYLQGNPTRPAITNITEGQNLQVGSGNFTINYTGNLKSVRGVALVALGSLTHAFDMGQRYVPLTVVSGGGATGSVVVRAPTNINIAQPGFYNLFIIDTAGVPSIGKSVRLTPPPACVYGVNGNASSYIEAELSSRKDGPFVTTPDGSRSNGNYVDITEGSGNHPTAPDEAKVMWYDVDVINGGDFFIWALANAPDTNGNTAWVSVNGGPDSLFTATGTGTWNWVRLSATASAIGAGRNTLKVKVNEDGLKIDKLVLTTNGSFTPAGIANTAQACNGPAIPNAPSATPSSGQVNLSWAGVTGATSYTVRWGTSSGNYPNSQPGITGTSTTIGGLTNGTQHFFVVSAHTATLASGLSDETSATPGGAPTWLSQDIGAVAMPGSWTFNTGTGVHTVVGNGADIWTAADEFRFTYQTLTGDGNITARLTGFTGMGTINANAKAGVMIRESLTAGSPHLLSCLPVQGQTTLIKQIRRTVANATSSSTTGASPTFPRWVRVTRTGNSLATFESTNGTTWTQVGSPQNIPTLGATTFVGLAVTSHVDGTNYTATFDNVSVNPAIVNAPPTVATAAAASPDPAPGTTTALSVLGADDAGEAALTYTWSTTGSPPAPVTFSVNGTNAAKNTTATFTKAGTYAFQVLIRDAGNLTVTSSVSMTVSQTLTSIVVAPASAIVSTNGTQQFTATARDQFAIALTSQPSFSWMVSGGGTIDTGGLFTAGATPGGPFTVTATSSDVNGIGQVTVTLPNEPPTVATAAAASPDPAPGATTALSVLGADDAGEAALTYTWSTTGSPPASVSFSANGTNAAKNATATFTKAGNYSFQVEIRDAGNLTVISAVSMTVSQTLTSIVVAPATANVVTGNTQQFTATARDQFATALTGQPSFTWMVSGGGTIDASGLFTAGATPGGPHTVTASSGAVNGTAQVTVTSAIPAAPSNLTATTSGATTVNLSWLDNSNNETGFRVDRKVNAGGFTTFTTVGIGTQGASDTTVTTGNTYTYRVVALGAPPQESPASNEAVAVLRGMEADAYVRGGVNGNLNYGGATVLEAKLNTTPADNNREFFVRFDLTDVRTTVSSAKIRIFGNANTTAKTISCSGVSSVTWVEGTGTGQAVAGITYNTKPAIGSQITSQSVGITAGFWEFDITSYVQAQKTAGATKISLSFRQTTNSTNGQTSFSSRQNATAINRPLVLISSK